MTATTQEGFDSVSQYGSGVAWTDLSSMAYSTEGTGACELTAAAQVANTVFLRIPHEAADIPTGATFDSMTLYISVKKTGAFSSATNVYWTGSLSSSLSTVWSYTLSTDESYINLSPGGDRAYWKISSGYDLAAMIDGLKDGTLYFRVNAETTSAVACGIRIDAATVIINYTAVFGERGAIIATLV